MSMAQAVQGRIRSIAVGKARLDPGGRKRRRNGVQGAMAQFARLGDVHELTLSVFTVADGVRLLGLPLRSSIHEGSCLPPGFAPNPSVRQISRRKCHECNLEVSTTCTAEEDTRDEPVGLLSSNDGYPPMNMPETMENSSFIKLSGARNWSLGGEAAPTNTDLLSLEVEPTEEDRRQTSLLEYESLKQELSLMTMGVAVAVGMYCCFLLSLQTAFSYAIGAIGSLLYLHLLFRHADDVSKEDVPAVFVQRKVKTIGFRSSDFKESVEKLVWGTGRSLSSPRLAIPTGLVGLWAASNHFGENPGFHLELTPLLLGFFAYKGATLLQAYRDNKDLLFIFPSADKDSS